MLVLLRAVLDRIAFAGGLFAGSQVPKFLADLRQHVAGALGEAERQVAAFQGLADRYAEGSLDGLIEQHRLSGEALFRDEAVAIEGMVLRRAELAEAAAALDDAYPGPLWWLARHGESELVGETWARFQPGLVIGYDALVMALASGFAATLLFVGLWSLVALPVRRLRARRGAG